ncbi:MAG: helix-turn-helix transcriptional regulator [Eubacteriales bacterium]|nr:helix-turn-helix transcriptional regulator [Eubacteriales bacterium]
MTLGDKLSKLRKENNYTQEQLADVLGVSRQAISKWESNITYPETEKLIRMSEMFQCSLDYLLKDEEEMVGGQQADSGFLFFRKRLRERKSEKTVMGMPLWHIARNAKGFVAVGLNARGVIAIGLKAQGVVSLGMLSIGVFSFGMLSIGLLAIGVFALGVLSAGCFALGILTAGAISLGVISLGAIAIGDFSVGALSIGKYFALGDNARAMIALGVTKAAGSVFQKIGELSTQDITAVKHSLDTIVPAYLSWAKEIIMLFL